MNHLIAKFYNRYGIIGILKILFSPISVILTTPFMLVDSLYESRVLADGQWLRYNRFNPHRGLNSLFYWNQALNLDLYSFKGVSPLIGNGSFELSRWFHISLPSIYLYWRLGPVSLFVGMFGWLFMHLFWVTGDSATYLPLIMFSLLCCSCFYSNMFELQNYNVFGWLFFPAGIWAIYNQQYALAGIFWLLCGYGGITACFTAGVLCFANAVSTGSLMPLLTMVPVGIKFLFHFKRMLKDGYLWQQILTVAKGIGFAKGKRKFQLKMLKGDYLITLFYSFSYGQFLLVHTFLTGEIDWMFVSLLTLMIVNNLKLFRYADFGSIFMPVMSLASAMLLMNFSWPLFISWLFLINPPPIFLLFSGNKQNLSSVPLRQPFDLQPVQEGIKRLFQNIPAGEKVLCCFNHPKNDYGAVFDGHRVLYEAFLYYTAERKIQVFPDWYLVFEYNISDEVKPFWGRKIDEISQNLAQWDTNYFLFPAGSEEQAAELVQTGKCEVLSVIDWQQVEKESMCDLQQKDSGRLWYLFKYLENDECAK